MNRLKLELAGRMPLFGEDQYYMETYLREGIQAILKAFDTDPLHGFVIAGCEYDTENDVISAGYIYLNGEMIKVDAQSSTPVSEYICCFTLVTTDYTPRVFGDGVTRNVRIMELGQNSWYTSQPANSVNINDTLLKRISAGLVNEGWKTFTLESGYTHATPTLKYRKNKVNNVEISGSFSGLVGDHFATLPVGYRPPYDVVIPIKTATGFNVVNITAS